MYPAGERMEGMGVGKGTEGGGILVDFSSACIEVVFASFFLNLVTVCRRRLRLYLACPCDTSNGSRTGSNSDKVLLHTDVKKGMLHMLAMALVAMLAVALVVIVEADSAARDW